ncbi:hypothetical protein [Actinacidiphila paucisporea]|uniref:Lipoprotein n=1 Tax=Actinacidiphila paucisporea TaxID=310782 RepID=A0A1M7ARR0_9ACTN|nr:hypothetical protein [Actinacidiphila paucisporea]SHL45365.1 hypothetical protein SAMN05216499_104173 [Actinacidiphila paucisporea]
MSGARGKALALLPAAALAALLLTGCGSHSGAAGPAGPGSTSPTPAASELAHMQKLVDDADSAAAVADSDAAADR